MQQHRNVTAVLLFCFAAPVLCAQEQYLKAEITPARTAVKNDEIFSVTTVVRNVGTKEQSLTVWDCSYPAEWLPDNPAVHVLAVPCKQNVPGVTRLNPGESFKRSTSVYIHLHAGQIDGTRVTFRLGYGKWAYFGTQNFSPKVPLFWSNAVTVVVDNRSSSRK